MHINVIRGRWLQVIAIQYRSDTTYQSKHQINPGFTFGVYFRLVWVCFLKNFPIGVYMEIAFGVNCTQCTVRQTRPLFYHPTACNPCPLHIPNKLSASAFRGIHLTGFTLFCPLWVYFGFTLGLLWFHFSKLRVNPESKLRVKFGFTFC